MRKIEEFNSLKDHIWNNEFLLHRYRELYSQSDSILHLHETRQPPNADNSMFQSLSSKVWDTFTRLINGFEFTFDLDVHDVYLIYLANEEDDELAMEWIDQNILENHITEDTDRYLTPF